MGFAAGAMGANSQGALRPWLQKSLTAASMIAPKSALAGGIAMLNQGMEQLAMPLVEGAARVNAAKGFFSRMKEVGSYAASNPWSVGGAGIGLGYAAFSNNALGLTVPSNYGYR
jgi:hypothetical protein